MDVHWQNSRRWANRSHPHLFVWTPDNASTKHRHQVYAEVYAWCMAEFGGVNYWRWYGSRDGLWFQLRERDDAFAFRMRWG